MEFLFEFLFTPLSSSGLVFLFSLAAIALLHLNTRPKPLHLPTNLNCQSVGIEGGARKSALMKDDNLISSLYQDAKTLYEVYQRGLRVSGNGPCLGYRKKGQPFQWLKYKQVSDRAEFLGSALLHRGLKPSQESFIGIFAQNRPEWIIAELACYTYSMVAVPLYDTLGSEALVFIINRAKISTVLCDKQDKAEMLLAKCEKKLTPVLKTIILMDPFDPALSERGSKSGVDVLNLKDVEAFGKDNLHKPVPPKPEDLSIICFTSGTTGDPKGAMLTHENVVADAAGVLHSFENVFVPLPTDVSISFLPLAHMFERVVQTVMYGAGGRVGFFQGDIRLLPDDMKALQPTIFPVVPRLLNRIYDKVQSGAQTPIKKLLLNFAIERKHAEMKQGIIRNDSIWDKLIFHKVQETLGGRVRVMVTGAAPISPAVLSFLRACLGCQIFEAYGQTECTAACTFSMPCDWTTGHVGIPVSCNIVKLVDVVEMNYFASNGEGEVCVKGKNVFLGYLNDPEKTAEALDKDGWLHTGDIGKWLPSGVLKIIDRKKNIFKLSQGEYIAPEKIENVYIRSAPVAQVFVHGDSLQSCLVAIVVPDPEVLPGFAEKLGVKGSFVELCKNQEIKKAVLSDLNKLGHEAGLKSFEQVKDLYLHPDMFTIENGLLTPTLKAKRADLTKFFKVQIDRLYANM
ncbi:LOW QUALITY PROTEIN: long-chain-fatty-acid--CoA ligase 5-like [Xyrauchen texanus]|uniref:LOW QUALITY PROTEIN: long-chain-fatty-acid--CoA ligase 5-like n=1 Tax=Xyrauchen texanus TaxID=154827 RepID=UPI002241DCE7|nr:LOW QUALITY PROTEIN: long-chain-fatty-acid--CoA ligase 5-like [Xyrauchen texanus]